MRVSMDPYTYIQRFRSGEWTMWDYLDHCDRLGLDGAHVSTGNLPSYPAIKEDEVLKVRKFMDGRGWEKVLSEGGGYASDRTGAVVKRTVDRMEVARLLGARVMRITPGGNRHESRRPQIDRAVENLKKCVDAAASYGVVLGVENHDALPFVRDVREVVERVDSEYLGITLDTGNLYQWVPPSMGEDPVEAAEGVAGHVVATHIRDMVYEGPPTRREPMGTWYCVPCGEGTANLKAVAEALKDAGYRGTMAQEFLNVKSGDRDEAIRKGVEYLRKL